MPARKPSPKGKTTAKAVKAEERAWVKVYKNPSGILVAACDEGLLGKVLDREASPGEVVPFFVTPRFYQGELKTLEELKGAVEASSQANLVGEGIVRFLLAHKIITQKSVIMLGKTPHVVLMRV